MVDLLSLSAKSGLPFWVLQRVVSAGLDPLILDFSVHAGLRFAPAFVTASDLRRWYEVDHLAINEVNLLIRDLVLDEVEGFFCETFGVVGVNDPCRSQGTGFEKD